MAKSKIEAYNVSSKQKEELNDVVINRNGNRCMAKGTFKSNGKTGCVTMGLESAKAAVSEGRANKGEGW